MSKNPTDQCTRCGGTGHSLSACKWPRLDEVRELIAKAGKKGIERAEIQATLSLSRSSAERRLMRLRDDGIVFCGGNGQHYRWFTSKQDAEAFHQPRSFIVAAGKIRTILVAAGVAGSTWSEIVEKSGCNQSDIEDGLAWMRKNGQAFSAGKNHTFRTFATKEDAEAYREWRAVKRLKDKRASQQTIKAAVAPKKEAKPKKLGTITYALRENKKKDAEKAAIAPDFSKIPAVNPNGVSVTVLPCRPGRYEVSGPVIGGFATMGIGRYLEAA